MVFDEPALQAEEQQPTTGEHIDLTAREYELSDSTGHLMLSVISEVKRQFMHRAEAYGVTSQQCPPLMLLYRGICGTPSEMARAMGIDVGAVSRLVDRLENKGFVQRIPHERDLRSVRIELTEAGRRVAPRLLEASKHANDHVFGAALGKLGARALHKSLQRVSDHVSQAGSVGDQQDPRGLPG